MKYTTRKWRPAQNESGKKQHQHLIIIHLMTNHFSPLIFIVSSFCSLSLLICESFRVLCRFQVDRHIVLDINILSFVMLNIVNVLYILWMPYFCVFCFNSHSIFSLHSINSNASNQIFGFFLLHQSFDFAFFFNLLIFMPHAIRPFSLAPPFMYE